MAELTHHDMPMPDCDNCNVTMISIMPMSFFFKTKSEVLFKLWKFSTVGGLVGTMFAIIAMAFAYEALKFYRSYLLANSNNIRNKNKCSGDDRFSKRTILSKTHLIQTVLYAVQVTLSYFLMLIFMTYNTYLCIAVTIGLVGGYFIFGWCTPEGSQDMSDHCT